MANPNHRTLFQGIKIIPAFCKSLIFLSFLSIASAGNVGSKIGHASRRGCLYALGIVSDTESTFVALSKGVQMLTLAPVGKLLNLQPSDYATFTGRVYDPITNQNFVVTGRYLTTLSSLGLLGYDFRNKQIATVASGSSRLGQGINLAYSSTGTVVTSVDLYSEGVHIIKGKSNFVKGSAFDIPLPDKSQDLSISHWFLDYLKFEEAVIFLDQMVRITKDGGEIRLGTLSPVQDADELRTKLLENPRVESIEGFRSLPTGYIQIKLK